VWLPILRQIDFGEGVVCSLHCGHALFLSDLSSKFVAGHGFAPARVQCAESALRELPSHAEPHIDLSGNHGFFTTATQFRHHRDGQQFRFLLRDGLQ
jgi:hypothetical protein